MGLAKRLPIVSIQILCHFNIISAFKPSFMPCCYHYKLHSGHSLGKNTKFDSSPISIFFS